MSQSRVRGGLTIRGLMFSAVLAMGLALPAFCSAQGLKLDQATEKETDGLDKPNPHFELECAECHGKPAVYQPLPFGECGDCHEDPHQERLGSECESCHDEVSWKKTRMARGVHPGVSLAGGHERVACKSCHDRGNLLPPSTLSKLEIFMLNVMRFRGQASDAALIEHQGVETGAGIQPERRQRPEFEVGQRNRAARGLDRRE